MLALPDRRAFLETFFSGDNRFHWTAITAGDSSVRDLYVWAERLLQDPPLPTVLPYANAKDTTWYALAPNDLALRRLAEDLLAFAGPTWSSLRGTPSPLIPQSPVDQEVWKVSEGQAFKFEGAQAQSGELGLKAALNRMRVVWSREKRSEMTLPESRDLLLRRFAMAIAAQNRKEAEQALEALKLNHHLDAQNLLFLQVRMLYELGRSLELLNLDGWDDLLRNRRPLAVTEAMAAAVYSVYLETYESQDDPAKALEAYRDVVKPRFETLGAYHGNSRHPALLKLRMLHALSASSPPRPELLEALVNQAGDPATRKYLIRLKALAPAALVVPVAVPEAVTPSPAVDPLSEAIENLDFDHAFELACTLPPSERKVQVLAMCAEEFETLEAEQALLKAFEELDVKGQERILSSRKLRKQLEALTEAPQGQAPPRPEDWLGWVQAVLAAPSWKQALDAATRGVREWPIAALAETPSRVAELVSLLRASHSPEAQRILMNGLPHLIQAVLQDAERPRSSFVELYAALRDLLLFEGSRNRSEADLFANLSEATLDLGMNAREYQELLGYAEEIWRNIASPATVSWLLAFLELLAVYPCPDRGARQALLVQLVPELRGFAPRMDRLQHQMLAAVARDFGMEALLDGWPFPEKEDPEVQLEWSVLRDKKMLMYSLQIRMMQRVGETLQKREPSLKITYTEEKSGSPTLRSQVRNADIVVVHTWHAKHAAGNFIEDHLPPHAAYLRPEGSGSESIMRAIEYYCRSLQA